MTKPSLNEIEINLLAAYIDNEDLFSKCEHLVSEKLWGNKVNRIAYKIIRQLRSQNIKPDLILLTKELKKKGVSDKSIPIYHVTHSNYRFQPEQYVIQLFEENIKRYLSPELHAAYNDFQTGGRSPLEVMEALKGKINDIELVLNNVSSIKSTNDLAKSVVEEIKEQRNLVGKKGYTTTLAKLDEITGGLLPGIYVIGGLPGSGKTSTLINIIVQNAVYDKVPIVFFSLEMSSKQVIKNIYCNMYEINTMAMRDNDLTEQQLDQISKTVFKDNLIIDDTPDISAQYIDAQLTKIRKRIPIETQMVVMIDYLQQMANTDDESELSNTCKQLMNLRKKHNICLIELCQFGREITKEMIRDSSKRPRMSDAKGSGAIEANADVFIILHRADYFHENATDNFGRSLKGKMEAHVDKNRLGRKGRAYGDFFGQYSKIKEIDRTDWERQKSGGGII